MIKKAKQLGLKQSVSIKLILNIRYILIIGFLVIFSNLKCQDFELDSYLLGDWYFLSEPKENCDFDSAYNEITFSDSFYHFIDECTRFEYSFNYKIKDSKITAFADTDSHIVMTGLIEIMDTMHFRLRIADNDLNFHRIIDTDYRLSEYLHDNIELTKLDLSLPRKIRNTILSPATNYYYGCLKRRELWLRLERNEIDKQAVIKWANQMIDYCDTSFEVHKYEMFVSRINDIF